MFATITENIDSVKTKAILYIIIGVIIIVLISLLLDLVRKYIRGLDIAALGALFIWLGYEAAKNTITKSATAYLYAAGGALFGSGLIAFILIKVIRHKRAVKRKMAMENEKLMQQREKALREQEQAKHMAAE